MGVDIDVKLGIVGVINRSEKYIDLNKSFKETIEQEHTFLKQKFPGIASQNGTSYFAHRINRLLLTHIEKHFPELKVRISLL